MSTASSLDESGRLASLLSSQSSYNSKKAIHRPYQSTSRSQRTATPSSEGFETEEDDEEGEEQEGIEEEPIAYNEESHITRTSTAPASASARRARPSSASSSYHVPTPPRKAVSRTPTRSSPRSATAVYRSRNSGLRSRNTQIESLPPGSSHSPGRGTKNRSTNEQGSPTTSRPLPRLQKEALKKFGGVREEHGDNRDICTTPLRESSIKPPSPRTFSTSKSDKSFVGELGDTSYFYARVIYYSARMAFRMMKRPLAWLVVSYMIAILLALGVQQITHAFTKAMTPLCSVPGVPSIVPVCRRINEDPHAQFDLPVWPKMSRVLTPWTLFHPHKHRTPDFPSLTNVQSHLSTVLASAEISSIMGLELKNAEISVRDLGTLVKVSNLGCKTSLKEHLDEFVQESKTTSLALSRFESKVGGTIDTMVAVNKYSLKILEEAKEMATIASSDSKGFFGLILAPFRAGNTDIEAKIQKTFVDTSSVLESKLRYLIIEAQLVLGHLDGLETKLTTISEVVATESGRVDDQHEEILGELWTILGGNKRKLKNLEGHRALLGNIGQYRSRALQQVSNTLLQLQEMSTDLEQLRDKYAEPLVASEELESGNIPLEVQITAIQEGVKRMVERRERTKQRHLKDASDILRKVGAQDPDAVVQNKIVGGEGDEIWGTKYSTRKKA